MDRPLTAQEELFCRLDRAQAMNVVAVAAVRGAIDVRALHEALASLQSRHPVLRARIPDGRLTGGDHRAIPVRMVTAETWESVVDQELGTHFDVNTAPLARVVLVSGTGAEADVHAATDGRPMTHMLFVYHHAIADGMSGIIMIRDTLAAMAVEPQQPAHRYSASSEPDDATAQTADAVVATNASLPFHPRVVHAAMTPAQVQTLVQQCRANEVSVHAVICAAMVLETAARYPDVHAYFCTSPISLRSHVAPPATDEVGLFIAAATVAFSNVAGRSLIDVAKEINTRLREEIHSDHLLARRDASTSAVLGGIERGKIQHVTPFAPGHIGVTNLGVLSVPDVLGDLAIEALHFTSTPPAAQFVLSVSTHNEQLFANLCYPSPHATAAQANDLLDAVITRLGSATREPNDTAARVAELTDRQRDRLRALLEERAAAAAHADHPLSHAQRSMWVMNALAPDSPAYVQPFAAFMAADVDPAALSRAVVGLADRHASLRTTFVRVDGEPRQRIHARPATSLEMVDAAGWSERRLDQAVREAYHRPFDLEQAPAWRAVLFTRGGEPPLLFLAIHHIIYDFWSLFVLLHDLETLYAAERTGQLASLPDAAPYTQHVMAERSYLESAAAERALAFWQKRLAGATPLQLPTDRGRPATPSLQGASLTFTIGEHATSAIRDLARRNDATLFATITALFGALLYRYSGQTQFFIGAPTSGRESGRVYRTVGDFVNPVAVAIDLDARTTLQDHVRRTRDSVVAALAHREYPFSLLVERLAPTRDASISPVFQTMVVLQNQVDAVRGKLGGERVDNDLALVPHPVPIEGSQLDLTLDVLDNGTTLAAAFKYSTDLFDRSTIEVMRDALLQIVAACDGSDSTPVSRLPLIDDRARDRLLRIGQGPPAPDANPPTVHAAFLERAQRAPSALAVSCDGVSMTYAELAGQSSQFGRSVTETAGGPLVGVMHDRSVAAVAAMLGVLRAGYAYVPLDPAQPDARLRHIVQDAGGEHGLVIIADAANNARAAHLSSAQPMRRNGSPVTPAPDERPLAYAMYTSGSTGAPKGVEVEHASVLNVLRHFATALDLKETDVLLAVTTFAFDISVLEVFMPLVTGARVEILPTRELADGPAIIRRIAASGATIMQATPSTWQLVSDAGWTPPPGFRVLCGGEALPLALARRLASNGASVWNVYGPTETTIWSTIARIEPDTDSVSIGTPIAGTSVRVLDPNGEMVPFGVPGELFIAGVGVARGYHNNPSLTAERFASPPAFGGPPAYRTGDIVRWRQDGTLEYIGRRDGQVKLRGNRIELGEVESVIRAFDGVTDAAVVLHSPGSATASLAAYITSPSATLDARALRDWLLERLPAYMVPSTIERLDALPLNPNGKIDRAALAMRTPQRTADAKAIHDGAKIPPSALERRVLEIWHAVLGTTDVTVDDNFFDAGGHSMLLARVQSRLREELGRDIAMVTLFQHTTVRALCRHLSDNNDRPQSAVERARSRAEMRRGSAARATGQAEA